MKEIEESNATPPSSGVLRNLRQSYAQRIEQLRQYGTEEGCSMSSLSEYDFWCFFQRLSATSNLKGGNLVLTDDGNLRAIWLGENGTRIGIEFLGHGFVQYVIFKQRGSNQHVSRVAGRDTFEGVHKQIEAFDLDTVFDVRAISSSAN